MKGRKGSACSAEGGYSKQIILHCFPDAVGGMGLAVMVMRKQLAYLLSEAMELVCIPLGVKEAFRPMKTWRQTLMKVKNYIPEEWRRLKRGLQSTLYRVPPNLRQGLNRPWPGELKQAVPRVDPKNSITVHSYQSQHAVLIWTCALKATTCTAHTTTWSWSLGSGNLSDCWPRKWHFPAESYPCTSVCIWGLYCRRSL